MLLRVYWLKHTVSEMLKRTTGKQDSGLETEDPTKPKVSILIFNLYSLKVFSSICDPYKPIYSF